MADSIFPGEQPDRLEEECGVFGVYAPGEDVARLTCYGLQALQHRGQESAGIAVGDGSTVIEAKDLGLVTQVFDEATLAGLGEGVVAIGHVRYSTTGANTMQNVQPFVTEFLTGRIATVHNGNVTNAGEMREKLEPFGLDFSATSDSEVISSLIAYKTLKAGNLLDGAMAAAKLLERLGRRRT